MEGGGDDVGGGDDSVDESYSEGNIVRLEGGTEMLLRPKRRLQPLSKIPGRVALGLGPLVTEAGYTSGSGSSDSHDPAESPIGDTPTARESASSQGRDEENNTAEVNIVRLEGGTDEVLQVQGGHEQGGRPNRLGFGLEFDTPVYPTVYSY